MIADNPAPTLIRLALVFMGLTFAMFVVYGACAAASHRDNVISRSGVLLWLKRSLAAAFVLLGAQLVFAMPAGQLGETPSSSHTSRP